MADLELSLTLLDSRGYRKISNGLALERHPNFSVNALSAAGSIALKPRLLGDFRQRLNGRHRNAILVLQSKNVLMPTRWERKRRSHDNQSSSVVGGGRG